MLTRFEASWESPLVVRVSPGQASSRLGASADGVDVHLEPGAAVAVTLEGGGSDVATWEAGPRTWDRVLGLTLLGPQDAQLWASQGRAHTDGVAQETPVLPAQVDEVEDHTLVGLDVLKAALERERPRRRRRFASHRPVPEQAWDVAPPGLPTPDGQGPGPSTEAEEDAETDATTIAPRRTRPQAPGEPPRVQAAANPAPVASTSPAPTAPQRALAPEDVDDPDATTVGPPRSLMQADETIALAPKQTGTATAGQDDDADLTIASPRPVRTPPAPSAPRLASPQTPHDPPPAQGAQQTSAPQAQAQEHASDVDPDATTALPRRQRQATQASSSIAAAHPPTAALAAPPAAAQAPSPAATPAAPPATPPSAAPRGAARILVVDAQGEREVALVSTLVIGRTPSPAQVRDRGAQGLAVVPTGTGVSHSHVAIRRMGGVVLVRDLWSTNGTRVRSGGVPPFRLRDGEEVPVSVGTVIELGDGVVITLLDAGEEA